jgi:hypothetical protein
MSSRILAVFTFRTISRILEEGGSQAWRLNPATAQRCSFLVCTRNRYHEGAGPEEHGAAFLVGKISSVEPSPETPDRFIVRISEYALLDPQPLVWPGSRNPVMYVDDFAKLGIDETALRWQPMPDLAKPGAGPPPIGKDRATALTITEAKAALAATFGVSPDKVEITIRG